MDAAGFDEIYLETVGVGQAEIDVVDHADSVVLVLVPGSGDSVQALKAGVMEIPDVIVVNKADHPLAQTTLREVRGVLALAPPGVLEVPVLLTDAVQRRGRRGARRVADAHLTHLVAEGTLAAAPPAQPAQRGHRASRPRAGAAQLEARLDGDARLRGAARRGRGAAP